MSLRATKFLLLAAIAIVVAFLLIRESPTRMATTGEPNPLKPSHPSADASAEHDLASRPVRTAAHGDPPVPTRREIRLELKGRSGLSAGQGRIVGYGIDKFGELMSVVDAIVSEGVGRASVPLDFVASAAAWLWAPDGHLWQQVHADGISFTADVVRIAVESDGGAFARVRCVGPTGVPLRSKTMVFRKIELGEAVQDAWWTDLDGLIASGLDGTMRAGIRGTVFSVTTDENGEFSIVGIDTGNYYAAEVKGEWAPAGPTVWLDGATSRMELGWVASIHITVSVDDIPLRHSESMYLCCEMFGPGGDRLDAFASRAGANRVEWIRRVTADPAEVESVVVACLSQSGARGRRSARAVRDSRVFVIDIVPDRQVDQRSELSIQLPPGVPLSTVTFFEKVLVGSCEPVRMDLESSPVSTIGTVVRCPIDRDAVGFGACIRVRGVSVVEWLPDWPAAPSGQPMAADFGKLGRIRLTRVSTDSAIARDVTLFASGGNPAILLRVGSQDLDIGPLPVGEWSVVAGRIVTVTVTEGETVTTAIE